MDPADKRRDTAYNAMVQFECAVAGVAEESPENSSSGGAIEFDTILQKEQGKVANKVTTRLRSLLGSWSRNE